RLHAGVQLIPQAWSTVRSLRVQVEAVHGDRREVLDVARFAAGEEPRWLELDADLASEAGAELTIEFRIAIEGLPPEHRHSAIVAWGPVVLAGPGGDSSAQRPNVLFILIDTLRADHLTPYGYSRDTSPNIESWLARKGTVFENAYSQAPWTIPSVASFLTGRMPGELMGADIGAFTMPVDTPTLGERLGKMGYETGGLFANPTLHAGIGFDRGFATFYSPPGTLEAIRLPCDGLRARAQDWLRGHQDGGPFFLYLHFVDPHDPYESPEVVNNHSPFEGEYHGKVAGTWVHGIYNGKLRLEDPVHDIPHIVALYDSEIHWVDRCVGQVLQTLRPEVLNNTLVVLTADHGEELHDHGGWKHGQSLYQEQIHVPLLMRWDGRIAAGRRLPGTVRLLDLVPTLVEAAGGTATGAEGTSLLPALLGREPLPRLMAFAQHLNGGPMRAAAVADERKLILFNRHAPFLHSDELQDYLWKHDVERLSRVEAYDLRQDPGEHENLASPAGLPAWAGAEEAAIHRGLENQFVGLRVMASGVPAGHRLSGTIRCDRPPARWVPYFLAGGDRVALEGKTLRFDLEGDAVQKGVLLVGDFTAIEDARLALDGKPLPMSAVRLGEGRAAEGGPWPLSGLGAATWPQPPSGPALRLFVPSHPPVVHPPADPETLRRLRALGYIQ
ncbi:MAG: sulfatase, partial [Acidobacteriota bacterium]